MNSTLKWALIAAAIWLFFRQQIEAAIGMTPAAAAPAPAPIPPAPPAAQPAVTDAQGTKAIMQAKAQTDAAYIAGNGRMSVYQWNVYYTAARGVEAPPPDTIGFPDGAVLISLDEYWAAASSRGLAGLRAPARRRRSLAAQAWSA
jgi:hypothetical protein